nr:hypothetical protein Iba_chr01eCG8260 [Ipomoea batatas]
MSEKRLSSEPISPQRSSEDDDLLERSTKKSKVRVGSQNGTMSAEEEGSSQSVDLQSEADVDMVAETPLNDLSDQAPTVSTMRGVSDPVPSSLGGAVAPAVAAVGDTTPAAVDGGARQKSYLDSVGSCPSFPVEATAQVSESPTSPVGEQALPPGDQRPLINPTGHSNGKATASRARPYGPWMIVTRAERRPPGRPPGQNVSVGLADVATGSSV